MQARYYCLWFVVLIAAQILAIMVLKSYVSSEFQKLNGFEKLLHCVVSSNFPFSTRDWDFRNDGGPEEHNARKEENSFEVTVNIFINWFFNTLLLSPVIYLYTTISERHLLLKSTIDTLPEEDEAYNLAKLLSWVFFPIFVVLALGQILLFNLFNDRFHPFVEILNGANTQVSNTGDIEMAIINPTTSNESRNQDASQDGVENELIGTLQPLLQTENSSDETNV